jgi:hypothetical protein
MKINTENGIALILFILLSLFACSVLTAAAPKEEKVTGRSWFSKEMGSLFVRSFLTSFVTQSVGTLAINHGPQNRLIQVSDNLPLDLYPLAVRMGSAYSVPKAADYMFPKNPVKDQDTFLHPYAQAIDSVPGSSLIFNPMAVNITPPILGFTHFFRAGYMVKAFASQNNTVTMLGSTLGSMASQKLIPQKNRPGLGIYWDLTDDGIQLS